MVTPGFNEVIWYFNKMIDSLDESSREKYGCTSSSVSILQSFQPVNVLTISSTVLGASGWKSTERTRANETMVILYFRTHAGLDSFAHSPLHREAWDWWNKTFKQHPDVGIMHEVYEVPRGKWENIYVNYHRSGIGRPPDQF